MHCACDEFLLAHAFLNTFSQKMFRTKKRNGKRCVCEPTIPTPFCLLFLFWLFSRLNQTELWINWEVFASNVQTTTNSPKGQGLLGPQNFCSHCRLHQKVCETCVGKNARFHPQRMKLLFGRIPSSWKTGIDVQEGKIKSFGWVKGLPISLRNKATCTFNQQSSFVVALGFGRLYFVSREVSFRKERLGLSFYVLKLDFQWPFKTTLPLWHRLKCQQLTIFLSTYKTELCWDIFELCPEERREAVTGCLAKAETKNWQSRQSWLLLISKTPVIHAGSVEWGVSNSSASHFIVSEVELFLWSWKQQLENLLPFSRCDICFSSWCVQRQHFMFSNTCMTFHKNRIAMLKLQPSTRLKNFSFLETFSWMFKNGAKAKL